MSGPDDDLFGDFHPERSEVEELQRFREALLRRVSEAIEQDEIPEDLVPLLLVEIAVTFRATMYTFAAEKPLNSGLKLDLDRFRRDIDHVVRAARKDADEFIAAAKRAKAGELPDEPE